jgi:lambda repressor-like predicted transcriptional regulator
VKSWRLHSGVARRICECTRVLPQTYLRRTGGICAPESAQDRHSLPISPEKLRRAMQARGISARVLSKKAGLSEATISHAMAGRQLAPDTVKKIADVLARIPPLVSVDELFDIVLISRRARGHARDTEAGAPSTAHGIPWR